MKKLTVFAWASLIGFFLIAAYPVQAQEKAIPLVISPAKHEVELLPGEQKTIEVSLFNRGASPISGVFKVSDFTVLDDVGTPTLVEKNPNPNRSGKDWVTVFTPNTIIEPQKELRTSIVLSPPRDAIAGGHYVAIYFEPFVNLSEGSSNVSVRIVSLVNIKISGEIKENSLISFFRAPRFFELAPIPVEFSLINSGNYHIAPTGTLTLKNMFGRTVDQLSIEKQNIFPGTNSRYETRLGKSFLLGPHTISLSMRYGESMKTIQKEQQVFVFPWRIFLILLVGLTILYYMSHIMRKKTVRAHSQDNLSSLKEKLKKRHE
ncbi:hypothetical protein A3G67_02385 [Candidatus Roizmanbacteria bacterium RIFCSPLOWO2_12_FULL_40_12]|nr:MAG: hypothetical protein A2W49_00240 [Candidatus Roizmanbacteria bacterium RIFCSPHIGHO2_12_41_18]OGK59894.1 MAG: hypothetical protein A3H84_02845 [Candidatus Roizmanbacteria bacterium RIFCSPLOWO2_02_FULL_40_13]OGK60402.1 MAG: hypothetical protein A3G67_02385 [Candidatus Roizmanbacteria bacterium RIFCSPLOWO2_12_FULL_40_12]